MGRAQADLGRPITRPELAWWLAWPGAAAPIQDALSPSRVGTRLADTHRTDRGHRGEGGALHEVATSYTCHGGAPVRWSLGLPSPREEALCAVEDVAWAFRLPEELRSLQALEHRARLLRSDVLLELADVRRRLVVGRLRAAAGEFEGRALITELRAAGERMGRWHAETPELTDNQRGGARPCPTGPQGGPGGRCRAS